MVEPPYNPPEMHDTQDDRVWVVRIVLFIFAAALFAYAARPAMALEEGSHLHVQVHNHPAPGASIPRAPYTFAVTILQHRAPGKVTSFRVSDSSTVKKSQAVSLGPCLDCSVSFNFTVDFSSWSCGEHELRWTANIPSTFEDNRQFTTSRAYVMLDGCTTNRHGRSGWYAGGGSWYEGVDYSIIVQQSPFSSVVPGGTARWRAQSNANRGCLFLNPDAHNGSMGTSLGPCWSGTSTITRTLPSTVRDGDKLAAYSEDSPSHAGLFVHRIGDAADGVIWMEWQSWWRTAGLSVP